MKLKPVWLTRAAAFGLALSVFAACGDDSTAPGDDVDIASAQAAVDDVVAKFFTSNPGLQSLNIFGVHIGTAVPSVAPNPDFSPETGSMYGLTQRLISMALDAQTRFTSDPAPLAIPANLLGVTFEWNPATGEYEPGTRTGAPADGVRFILYDNITDLNEIGYLDFSDRSNFTITPAAIDISLSIFSTTPTDPVEVISYDITGSAGNTGGSLVVDGFLSDGADRLDFDFLVSGSESGGFNGDFTYTYGDLVLSFAFDEDTSGAESVDISITNGADEILFVLDVDANGDIITGSGIYLNSTLVGTFSGNVETGDVSLANTEGDPLTQEQLLALAEIFVGIEQAVILTEELLALGLGLIGISIFF